MFISFLKKQKIIICFVLAITLSLSPVTSLSSAKKNTIPEKIGGKKVTIKGEMRGLWISFFDFEYKKYSYEKYKKKIKTMYSTAKKEGCNTIFFHVRPCSDALYPSAYYPWSAIISGKRGKNPGYDPLKYAIELAHKKGLSFHAWINPYRVTHSIKPLNKVAHSGQVYKWMKSGNASQKRNVLTYQGKKYLNPAKTDVQNLIVNGTLEIIKRYNVDGIHFDDYFYPNLGNKYKKNFDAKEYKEYKKNCKAHGQKHMNIVKWRRNNVSTLVNKLYTAIHATDPQCQFGISPAGNIDNLYAKNNYYVDVKRWLREPGFIDYLCPQIYWSFTHKVCPFKKTANKWGTLPRLSNINMYCGIAAFRAGINKLEARTIADTGWASKKSNILKRQVLHIRKTKLYNGYVLFDYVDLKRKSAKKELKNLRSIL